MGTKKNLKGLIAFMEDNRFDVAGVEPELVDRNRNGGRKVHKENTICSMRSFKDKRKKKELWELPTDKKGFLLCVGPTVRPCPKCAIGEANKLCGISSRCVLNLYWAVNRTNSLSANNVDAVDAVKQAFK